MKIHKTLSFMMAGILLAAQPALALPQGQTVVAGDAVFAQPSDQQMTITTSDKAIINYDQFNINTQESVQFIQPSASSLVLNRVVGADPSTILGSLSANGRVFLINPNGVIFGQQARIDVGSLVASTLGISNADFLNKNFVFEKGGKAGDITNLGVITAGEGIALMGTQVKNDGLLLARSGSVVLASGEKMTLDLTDQGLLGIALEGNATEGSVVNTGMIRADDGQVLLTARVMQDTFADVINNSGVIEASSLTNNGGVVRLVSEGEGVVSHSGEINVSGANQGGQVEISGEYVGLFGTAVIEAVGNAGGGTVLIGGSFQGQDPNIRHAQSTFMNSGAVIRADALNEGNGGKVVLWSDGITRVAGSILARGGLNGGDGGSVETSGKDLTTNGLSVDASAAVGRSGSWLLDPYDVYITAAATSNGSFDSASPNVFTATGNDANVDQADIQTSLNNGTGVTIRTTGAGLQNGDIYVNATITKSSGADATLTLTANRDIYVNNAIASTTNSGKLNVTMTANRDIDLAAGITTKGGDIDLETTTGKIDSSTGGVTLNADGADTGVAIGGKAGDVVVYAATSIGATHPINISANGDDSSGINPNNKGGDGSWNIDIEAGTTYNIGTITAKGGNANSAGGAGVGNGGDGGSLYLSGSGNSQVGDMIMTGGNGNATDGGNGGWGGFPTISGTGSGTIDLNRVNLSGGTGYGSGSGGQGGDLYVGSTEDLTLNDTVSNLGGAGPTTGVPGMVLLNSNGNITLNGANADILTGVFEAFADYNGDGTGTYSQNNAGSAVVANDTNCMIIAADFNLLGTINTGTYTLVISQSVSGATIGVGATPGNMTISGAELQRITATDLTIGDGANGTITVDNITAANSANLSGTTYLVATRDNARVIFANQASTFKALNAGADDGIAAGTNITTTVGDLSLNGDALNNIDTFDNINIAGGVTLSAAHDLILNALNGGVLLSGGAGSTATLGATNDIFQETFISKTAAGNVSLVMNAGRDIESNSAILSLTNSGALNVTMSAGRNIDLTADITTKGGNIDLTAANKIDSSNVGVTLNADGADTGVGADGGDAGDVTVTATAGSIGATNAIRLNANGDSADGISPNADGGAGGDITVTSGTAFHLGTVTASGGNASSAGAGVGNGGDGGSVTITGAGSSQIGNVILAGGSGNSAGDGNGGMAGSLNVTTSGAGVLSFQQIDQTGGTGYGSGVGGDGRGLYISAQEDVVFNDVVNTSGGAGPTNGAGGLIYVESYGNITLNGANADMITNDGYYANADMDGNGAGTYSQNNAGSSVTATGALSQIFAADFDLVGTINTGSQRLNIGTVVDGETIGVGDAVGGMSISGAELQRITTTNLIIGSDNWITNNGTITVDNVTAANSANLSGTTTLIAYTDNARVIFSNHASTFKALDVRADDGVDVNVNVTTTVGSLSLDGDYDGAPDTFDSVDLAGNVTLTSAGGITLSATNGGIVLSGANGTSNTITGGGDAAVDLAVITDDHNVNLTVSSQGDLTLAGGTALGSGTYHFLADSDNDGVNTLTVNGEISGDSALTLEGFGLNDTAQINADMTATSIDITGFGTVNKAPGVTLTPDTSSPDLVLDTPITGSSDVSASTSGSILSGSGTQPDVQAGGNATLEATSGVIGTADNPLDVSVGGQLSISVGGQIGNISAVLTGTTSDGTVTLVGEAPGLVIFNYKVVGGEGADAVNGTIGEVSSGGDSVVPVSTPVTDAVSGQPGDFQLQFEPDALSALGTEL